MTYDVWRMTYDVWRMTYQRHPSSSHTISQQDTCEHHRRACTRPCLAGLVEERSAARVMMVRDTARDTVQNKGEREYPTPTPTLLVTLTPTSTPGPPLTLSLILSLTLPTIGVERPVAVGLGNAPWRVILVRDHPTRENDRPRVVVLVLGRRIEVRDLWCGWGGGSGGGTNRVGRLCQIKFTGYF